jgi:16S rRNA (guanine966-N2)-methyltransferase
MFSILSSLDLVEGATVMDLFAGSGALGIEALSRGAGQVTFVDSEPAAVRTINDNLAVLGPVAVGATVIQGDALAVVRNRPKVDLVVADPPYAYDRWEELLDALQGRTDVLMAESGADLPLTPAWETVRVKQYGGTVVTVAQPGRQEGEA